MIFDGGESIFQTCGKCNAPIVIPADIFYKDETHQTLASDNFASLVNDRPVDVEQVTNELTPGKNLPKDEETIDPEARIEKFEVYQEKIGTSAVESKKAVDEIITPKKEVSFQPDSPYRSPFETEPKKTESKQQSRKSQINPVIVRVKNELQTGDKIEAIKIFREKFGTGLREAKEAVEAIERGETIDITGFQK